MLDRLLIWLLTKGYILLDVMPRAGQDAGYQNARASGGHPIQPHPVYARLVSRRRGGHLDLQLDQSRVHRTPQTDFCQFHAHRRNQPGANQGAKCSARNHTGASGYHRDRAFKLEWPSIVLVTPNPIEQDRAVLVRYPL